MKLKNILMCFAAMTVLFSCSDNEPILDKPEELDPTTLSICIDADGTIISKADGTDKTISNLYVMVFKTNGDYAGMDELDLDNDDDDDINNENGTAENKNIEVETGNHLVLVLANVKDENAIKGKSLSVIQAATTVLSDEKDGNLTMSSEVMEVTFLPNKRNKIGYSSIDGTTEVDAYPGLKGSPVKLYRSVARIQLSQITLSTTAADVNYGEPISFQLKEIFIANAKGYSQLASIINEKDNEKYLSIETSIIDEGKYLWWYGDWKEMTDGDVLKKIAETGAYENGILFSDVSNTPLLSETSLSYPVTIESDPEAVGGKFFYVYENENKEIGYQTLLILKGDYTYKKKEPIYEGDEYVSEGVYIARNRYYAVPVNPEGVKATNANKVLRDHIGVIRNTLYDLRVTINGPGSFYPYQPDAHLYFNAKVVVADWSEKVSIGTIDEPKEIN